MMVITHFGELFLFRAIEELTILLFYESYFPSHEVLNPADSDNSRNWYVFRQRTRINQVTKRSTWYEISGKLLQRRYNIAEKILPNSWRRLFLSLFCHCSRRRPIFGSDFRLTLRFILRKWRQKFPLLRPSFLSVNFLWANSTTYELSPNQHIWF